MPEQGQNLLENPGFEYQLQGWSVSSGSATYAADWQVYKSGRYSARGVEYTTGSLGRLYQDVTAKVVPGRLYKISGWIKTEGVSGAAVIGLDYVAPGGWTPVGGYIREIGSVQGSQDWTYHESAPFVVPPWHTDASALWFLFDFNAGRGTAYWDDVALVPVSRVYLPVMVRTSGG